MSLICMIEQNTASGSNVNITTKVIQYTKFRVCTIAWNGIETCKLAASSYSKICR